MNASRPPYRFRVANVGYLNSVPYRALSNPAWIEYGEWSPAECARKLQEDESDMAVLPIADYFAHGGYELLPYGIATDGPVESVFIFSKVPAEEIKEVLLDASSHTSACLAQILCKNGIIPVSKEVTFARVPSSEILKKIQGATAGVVIGDLAFSNRETFAHKFDLGKCWKDATGLPFVFAVCALRPERVTQSLVEALKREIEVGLSSKEVFAREWAEGHGLPMSPAVHYVKNTIRYNLTNEALEGAFLFLRMGRELGLFPDTEIRVYEEKAVTKNGATRTKTLLKRKSMDTLLLEASEGKRISIVEGVRLSKEASFADLALAADIRREALHPEKSVSYIVDRNINYTNVCNVYCRFCAFYRAPGKKGGYLLSKEELAQKIEETIAAGGIQILLQGGLNPELNIEYYEDLFRWMRKTYPVINLHALSADEILHIAEVSKISIDETFQRLIAAGLGSLPGAGAELLVDRVRSRIAKLKSSSEIWLDVHRAAHRHGITSTCTMMFGVEETWEDRILHLHKLRSVQDETNGFTAFITWSFQDENTKLRKSDTSAPEYLRVQAISRLFLDNFSNIQSSWVTQGPAVGQIALFFGANDFGSVMFEENVVSAAGTTFCMNSELIEHQITHAGFSPWRRDVHYNHV